MNAIIGVVLLGVIQGLTEFLPVSSSGHLVIGQLVFKLHKPSILLDAILHVGTLLPVVWLYRREVGQMFAALPRLPQAKARWSDDQGLRLLVGVMIGTIPTGLIGGLLNDLFEKLFSSTLAVGVSLMITGLVLLITLTARKKSAETEPERGFLTLTPLRALLTGIAQGCAITPGISRSGSTIATSLLLGVEREMAARFSFLLSLPAIVGALILQLRKAAGGGADIALFFAGAVASALAGYLALRWVVHFVKKGKVHWFTAYVWPVGIALIIYSLVK